MKVVSVAFALFSLIEGSTAFTTSKASFAVTSKLGQEQGKSTIVLNAKNPFFADMGKKAAKEEEDEDDIEALVRAEMKKKKVISNLRNANGVDYAPWMNISEEDEKKIRIMVAEKAAARKKRQEQERSVSGALLMDSQAQELSGTGLNAKVIGQDVELEWATGSERNTKGFIVKRRPAKSEKFEVIASYKDFGPLASKGPDGGVYRYLDDTLPNVGGWVYRITECEKNGRESDICQRLVEVQSAEDQRAAVIAGVGIALFGIAAVTAGLVLDPYAN